MNLQDKIMKAIKEGLTSAFNFDDIVDTQLDDIKIDQKIKTSANTVKRKVLYPQLILFVNDILKENDLALTLDEQNSLFEVCVSSKVYYKFPDNETFNEFIKTYCAINHTANLNWIDTSNITDMSEMFSWSEFNGDISQWDMSSVTNMTAMFLCSKFNGDISSWDVSNVTDMQYMFIFSYFNGDISQWDVSSVTNMSGMFSGSKFNGDISSWDVSSVTEMTNMFNISKFNGDISKWDVSSVTDRKDMFKNCPIRPKFKPKFQK